ncbi:MAG: H-NS histone family protein [Burkholderiaceae bacterium]|nr:H-NS histone family protein [Burkholderiaceae bacterium]
MPTIEELLAQRADLDKQIAEMRQAERNRNKAKAKVLELMKKSGLTENDFFGEKRTPSIPKVAKRIENKYRDPVSGSTWSGRGKAPLWIAGKDRSQFAI